MLDDLALMIKSGERYIIVEGGKPRFVLLGFADYAALAGASRGPVLAPSSLARADLDAANAELQAVRQRPSADMPLEALPDRQAGLSVAAALTPDPLSIRLEDLPL